MKKNILRSVVFITLIFLAAGVVLGQGLYWESTISAPAAGKEVKSTNSYRPKMFKQTSENGAMIFRLDKEMMYLVDNVKMEYTEMTFAQMEAATKQAMSQIEELRKKMKDMPPEQRKQMEAMLGSSDMAGMSKSKIEVKKTGEKKTINGYACIKYILKENGKEVGTIWTTGAVADYAKMKNDMKEFSERLMTQMPNGKELANAMKKVEGFPIQTSIAGMTTTVTKVEKKLISISEFEVPAGYKKVKPQDNMGD